MKGKGKELSARQAASVIGCHWKTIYNMAERGELPFHRKQLRLREVIYFLEPELQAYLEKREKKGDDPDEWERRVTQAIVELAKHEWPKSQFDDFKITSFQVKVRS